MRSAEQISRTVEEYHDYQRGERQRLLRELLAILHEARDREAPWYMETLERDRLRAAGLNPFDPAVPHAGGPPEPDPDSPFQPPAPRHVPVREHAQGSLFG